MTYAERFTHEGGAIVAHVRYENAIKGVEKNWPRTNPHKNIFFTLPTNHGQASDSARLQEIRISLNRLASQGLEAICNDSGAEELKHT